MEGISRKLIEFNNIQNVSGNVRRNAAIPAINDTINYSNKVTYFSR